MDIKAFLSKVKQKATSGRGRSIFTFLIFLLISTIFWFMMTLNETIQRDYRLQVEIGEIPAGTTFITRAPQYIDVSVKDKGRALIKYDWGNPPKVRIRYSDFIKKGDNRIVINQEMLSNNIRNSFGSGCEILSIRPDSINLITTTRPGDRLPIFFDISTATEPQYIAYGGIQCKYDSVTVYSLNGIPSSMLNISTEHISLRNLTDTTTVEIPLQCPPGTRVEPSTVSVTIPVEPLVAKKRILPIQVVNVPKNVSIHIFPANIELGYLVPMSMFKNDAAVPAAVIDFRTINPGSTTAEVSITQVPDYYHNIDCNPSEVEYLIEQSSNSNAGTDTDNFKNSDQ
mgnify:FL=1